MWFQPTQSLFGTHPEQASGLKTPKMNDKKQEDTSKKMKLVIDGLNLMAVSTVFEWKLMQSGGEFSLICKFCYPVPSSLKNGIAIG